MAAYVATRHNENESAGKLSWGQGAAVMEDLVARIRRRDQHRSEAEVQADVRQFILSAPFELDEGDVENVLLESPLGDRRRIDIEVGSTVIEVKRDLRRGRVREEAVEQLSGYVATRAQQTGRRYVGVLTDGAEWLAYDLVDAALVLVSRLLIDDGSDATSRLMFWLEGVLATATGITPTGSEISARLGAGSSAHALDRATIATLYRQHADEPTVRVKRALWARLLTSALGTQFSDSDDLFVEHTLLVNTAEIIAHVVLGLPVADLNPASLLSGEKFAESGIHGVVEADFFDWVVEVEGGPQFVSTLARRLVRFDWSSVNEDVLKVLYESIIGSDTRKQLGEYYTPDWLAQVMVEETVLDPINTRVLDPSCGSGTFLFHTVRNYLAQADRLEEPRPLAEVLGGLTQHVMGMDLHPVAVTFARVTYLLAIGRERLTAPTRGNIHVPVFLGDSLQWREQQLDLLSAGELVIQADDQRELISSELRFPDSLLADADRFDHLVNELATRAAESGARTPQSLAPVFARLAIAAADQPVIDATFQTMCRLHREGRDHIWGYYVRNLARPMWLTRADNRVDVLIGNPPWLAYRHMTEEMQSTFRNMSERRHLWAGRELATQQDLAGLFVARATELYLRAGGRVAMVMPSAALDREPYLGFRVGNYSEPIGHVALAFRGSWDLRRLRPHFFPRAAGVVFAQRADTPSELPLETEVWTGRLPGGNASWELASGHVVRTSGSLRRTTGTGVSPFAPRFTQGAIFAPRFLFLVEERPAGPLGLAQGVMAVSSSRSANEKKPYKDLPSVDGVVESEFVRPLYSGESLLPYRMQNSILSVVPCTSSRLLKTSEIDSYRGLRQWWNQAESIWTTNRSSDRLSLMEQLDYQSKLSKQLPVAPFRVVYNKSGMHLAAAKLRDPRALLTNSLYWAAFYEEDEADFLCAILNSAVTTELARPLMSYGKDERHFDKHIWELPIPSYDASNPTHLELVALARTIAARSATIAVDPNLHFAATRRHFRQIIEASPEGSRVSELVFEILS
jgi:SAM-dependent methyltransferase